MKIHHRSITYVSSSVLICFWYPLVSLTVSCVAVSALIILWLNKNLERSSLFPILGRYYTSPLTLVTPSNGEWRLIIRKGAQGIHICKSFLWHSSDNALTHDPAPSLKTCDVLFGNSQCVFFFLSHPDDLSILFISSPDNKITHSAEFVFPAKHQNLATAGFHRRWWATLDESAIYYDLLISYGPRLCSIALSFRNE